MPTYLTIKEAADRAGKAEITIRRFVQSVVKEQTRSPKRKLIRPTAAEVQDLKKRKQPFSWKIADELIEKHYTQDESSVKKAGMSSKANIGMSETLQRELQSKEGQLQIKDEQIKALTEIVQSLNERMREGNVLMASLQQHLALPEARSEEKEEESTEKKSWIGRFFTSS
ncbi:hypothetical protein COU78_05545 [Candidatus Peregrinibacteria bacterium CG10_big_fil_rev_8_21_14_0_10_49_24]|nr:MAG: hypothetical protein COV83_03330 [Candidatus Peregrinibacteria bacterium CG11_big_fil_rev_8_21_14_0_20_49_14]PIR50592.1 MAG: hypothetical protein COU78_05545 [Candidatus Peregrinibacteria bacterium CG10_big_fil_rev_8_21_14_0_10_49_24]PJA67089.1 MAG: hypothetical protein CO157_06560 [Candidatus Peregrinibacteria bacterium CG_4_9_14_3_um_filter_49_12]